MTRATGNSARVLIGNWLGSFSTQDPDDGIFATDQQSQAGSASSDLPQVASAAAAPDSLALAALDSESAQAWQPSAADLTVSIRCARNSCCRVARRAVVSEDEVDPLSSMSKMHDIILSSTFFLKND